MDFDFILEQKAETSKKNLECWVPLQEDPVLRKNEIRSLWYGKDVVESLHLVKIAYLYMDAKEEIAYEPAGAEFDIVFLAARLKKVPYMVIYDHYKGNPEQLEKLERPYYIDLFYSPNFGTFRPKYFLFQQTSLTAIPDTMVLFRPL